MQKLLSYKKALYFTLFSCLSLVASYVFGRMAESDADLFGDVSSIKFINQAHADVPASGCGDSSTGDGGAAGCGSAGCGSADASSGSDADSGCDGSDGSGGAGGDADGGGGG